MLVNTVLTLSLITTKKNIRWKKSSLKGSLKYPSNPPLSRQGEKLDQIYVTFNWKSS